MFQLLAAISAIDLFRRQVPCFTTAFVLASAFYRFGNFALECVGFLATWFVLDVAYEGVARMVTTGRSISPEMRR